MDMNCIYRKCKDISPNIVYYYVYVLDKGY